MKQLSTRNPTEIIRFAGEELNFYVDVNAPREAMLTHMARNAVAPSALRG